MIQWLQLVDTSLMCNFASRLLLADDNITMVQAVLGGVLVAVNQL
jgi:hypothetical protein